MKMTKKTTALMLAITLAAAGTTVAYGDPGVSGSTEVKSAGSTNMTLTGNIKVTTLLSLIHILTRHRKKNRL